MQLRVVGYFLSFALATTALALLAGSAMSGGDGGKKSKDEAKKKEEKKAKDDAKGKDSSKSKDDKDGDAKSDSGKESLKVEKKPFRVEVTAKGMLEASEMVEIAYRPQPAMGGLTGPYTLAKVVEHGTPVVAGDVLAQFDTHRLDALIADLESDLKHADLALNSAKTELAILTKLAPIDLAAAERSKKQADENYKYWVDVARAESLKNSELFVKYANFRFENARDELRQLEKMYKANDLTEETEQIILKRQRFYFEDAKEDLRVAELQRDLFLKTTLPRKDVAMKESVVRESLSLEKAKASIEPGVVAKTAALHRQEFDRSKLADRLARLKKDRMAMTITSTVDGVVYHGKFSRGTWTTYVKPASHVNVPPDEVFLTVVKSRPVFARVQLEEKNASLIKPNLAGKATFAFNSQLKAPAKVRRVAAAPSSTGQFEAVIDVTLTGPGAEALVPGMSISVKFVPYSKKDAITIPVDYLHDDGGKSVVHVVDAKGQKQVRPVVVGITHDSRVEILSGVSEGEKLSAKAESK